VHMWCPGACSSPSDTPVPASVICLCERSKVTAEQPTLACGPACSKPSAGLVPTWSPTAVPHQPDASQNLQVPPAQHSRTLTEGMANPGLLQQYVS
jgi:hypothetical protein